MQSRRHFLKTTALTAAAATLPAAAQTGDPIAALKNMASAARPLETADYQARIERAQTLLKDAGWNALFVAGGTTLGYFTGTEWHLSERMFAVILPARGEPTWICPAFEEKRAMERIKIGANRVRIWQEHESPYELVRATLKDLGVASGKVAVEPEVRHFVVDGLAQAAPAVAWVAGNRISDGCRGVKTAKEVEYMRLANQITKKAFRTALSMLREGMSEGELGQIISRAHGALGTRGYAGVGFGPTSAFPHGSVIARKLQPGDIVLIDGGCSVQGYQSDVTRTTVFGKPSDKQRKLWDLINKAQDAAAAVARPGVRCEELDRAARKVIEAAGYGPGYKYFSHRLGHGIGMDGHEYPYLVEGNKLPLAPGMSFSDEPGVYLHGEFGVRLEDIIVVTESGVEFLGEKSSSIEEP